MEKVHEEGDVHVSILYYMLIETHSNLYFFLVLGHHHHSYFFSDIFPNNNYPPNLRIAPDLAKFVRSLYSKLSEYIIAV